MARSVCERYSRGESLFGVGLAPRFFASVRCDVLPGESSGEDYRIDRGYVVEVGEWWFFDAAEPAAAFGRAARMADGCSGYSLYEAATEARFCDRHGIDEVALLIRVSDRAVGDETHLLERFVQGVREHPDSAHWHAPSKTPAR